MRSILIALSILVALGACKGRREQGAATETTATIAPAAAQPAATDTGELTQTVSVEGENRSENEGAALTKQWSTTTAPTTTTTTAPPTATTTR